MLCEVCKSIDFGDLCYQWSQSFSDISTVVSPETEHHESYEILLESARKGCELCIEVEKGTRRGGATSNLERCYLGISCGPGLSTSLLRQTRDESAKGIAEFWFEWATYGNVDDEERFNGERFFHSVIRIFCEKESPAAALNIVSGRPIPTTPRSLESFETTQAWLRDCDCNHKNFCPSKRAALLPSRVIDVGSGNDPGLPHLHISKEGEMGNWATLSHCWGQISSHVTNVSNLDCRVHSISMQELPLTLKDAIEVTRRMGLKYLWVDSICILQGSDDAAQADWLFESSRMRDYYKCCDFCIAADDASSDEDGFLCITRTQRAKVPVSMSLAHWRRADSCVIYLQADLNPRSQDYRRHRSILATRGWTLQEHVLSPRALHYGHEQISWNCQFQKLSESNVNPEILWSSDRPQYGMDSKRFFLAPIHGKEYMYNNGDPLNAQLFNTRRRWYDLVNEYAARNLTFETDRLFALAALVQEIKAQSGFTYWAAAYVAPSWSWASRDISSSYDTCNLGNYPIDDWKLDSSLFKANISGCEIITVDGTLNGRLLNAKLTLRTRCLDSNQWESLQDVIIARNNFFLPWFSNENQIILSFDVQPSKSGRCLPLPLRVGGFQQKAKVILRWVSSSISNLVAKWRAGLASLSQKLTRARKRTTPILQNPKCFLSRKEAIERLSTVQRDSNYLTIEQIASSRDLAYAHGEDSYPDAQAAANNGSTMCLLVQPGTEEGTFRRVGLVQITDIEYGESLPWEMRTIVLV